MRYHGYELQNELNGRTEIEMVARTKFSSSVSPDILARMRDIARADGRTLNAVLEDAISAYIENRDGKNVRPEVMEHFEASVKRNRRLMELLADS